MRLEMPDIPVSACLSKYSSDGYPFFLHACMSSFVHSMIKKINLLFPLRKRMSGQGCKDTTDRTGLTAQGCTDRSVRIRQPGQNRKERIAAKTARTRQPEQNLQNRASRTGQAEQDCHHRTFRIILRGQDGQRAGPG
jgi:hypothetical protein